MVSLPPPDAPPALRRRRGATPVSLLLVVCSGLLTPAAQGAPADGSLQILVEQTAVRLEQRALSEGVQGPVRLDVSAGRGLSPARVDRVFTPRLSARLSRGGVVMPSVRAQVALTSVVSLERGQFWVVSVFEGGTLEGPTSVALSRQADRELLSVFGRSRTAPGAQWRTARLGEVAPGVLDVVLMDTDGDFADELVVLTVDGLRVYRASVGDARVDPVRPLIPLPPTERGWPRVVNGWIAEAPLPEDTCYVATSAGHHLAVNVVSGALRPSHVGFVPLKGEASERNRTLLARGGYGGPLLAPPLKDGRGERFRPEGLPARLRDAVITDGGFLLNTESGVLLEVRGEAIPVALERNDRVGDRIAVADFDGDGQLDVATSSGAPPYAADRFTIQRVRATATEGPLFQGTLSGGSIVGFAVGDIDLDEHTDLIVAEAAPDGVTLLWHVEHSP